MKQFLGLFTIFLFGIYGAKLVFENNLGLYINKRYESFFTIASDICIVVGLAGIIFCFTQVLKNRYSFKQELSPKSLLFLIGNYLPIVAVLSAGFLLPAKPFSPSLAPVTLGKTAGAAVGFSHTANRSNTTGNDSTKYTFQYWLGLREVDKDFSMERGKKIKLTGVLVKPQELPADMMYIGRMMVTCCTVDARLYGFPLVYQLKPNDNLKVNDWIEIAGYFSVKHFNNDDQLVIVAQTVTKTKQPHDPYMYY